MVVIEKHYNHDMGESSMSVDVQENHQIVLLPKHFQQQDNNDVEFQPSPNGTPYWVPDVPEDGKPKRGPTRAHRLKVTLVGGYDKVRGTSTDYCNFRHAVNLFIGDRDAQMYGYKFVPFTGIDHNQKCVTFGAALLSDETTESFCWMLEAFLKTHKKQPPFAVTDQDGALRNAIVKMFPESHHRLCMWHITQKLPGKVLGDIDADR
nr:hypothetical protein [Tanacetum cinerariifolium]